MEQHTDTPTPPSGTSGTSPLRRSRSDRVVAGVAAGIAERIDLPPWLIRVVFIVLTVGGGFGIALYLAGWLLIPEEGSDEPIVKGAFARVEGATGWIGVALIAIAVLVVIDSIGFVRGDLVLAAVLIVAGVLLYRGEFGKRPAPAVTPEDPADEPPDIREADAEAPAPPVPPAAATPPPPPPPPPPPKPARPRSYLGRMTVAVGLLVIGVMWLAEYAVAAFDPAPRHYLAVAVGIVGVGLLVSTFIGRARGLIVLGIFLVPMLLIAPLADFEYSGSIGERTYRPTTFEDLQERYELGAGQMVVDLSAIDFDGRTASIDIRLGFGELDVWVPDDVEVEIDARIGAGEVQAGSVGRSGVARTLETVFPGDDGRLVLDIDMNIGDAQIRPGAPRAGLDSVIADEMIVVVDPDDLAPRYDMGAGTLVLDLSHVILLDDERVTVDMGTGELRVLVPPDVGLDIEATVGVGDLDLLGSRSDGFDLDGTFSRTDIEPVLGLDLEVGAGTLIVEER